MRTVFWDFERGTVNMIDQRAIPWSLEVIAYSDYQAVGQAIQEMVVRGAPAIGAAAAFGLALAAFQSRATDRLTLLKDVEAAATTLNAARPTAVNLQWALQRLLRVAANEEIDTTDDLRRAFVEANPDLRTDMLGVSCRGNALAEVRICLDTDLRPRPCGRGIGMRCPRTTLRIPLIR